MIAEHIQRIEDAYDSVQSLIDSVEPDSYDKLVLQDAMKLLSVVLEMTQVK